MDNIKRVIREHSDIIQYEEDEAKPPLVTKNLIMFNGIGENAHETFYFQYPPSKEDIKNNSSDEDGFVFSFCKTARKPYDIAVCKCLLILKEYLKDDMKLSSDGDWNNEEEWLPSINAVTKMGIEILPYIVADEL